LSFVFACLVFTPVASHSFVLGFSGTIWLLSNAFSVGAILCLYRAVESASRGWTAIAVMLGLAGALTYSTNASLWPALLIGALVSRASWQRVAVVLGGAVVALGFFILTYETPPFHPEPDVSHPGSLFSYCAAYLGALYSGEVAGARTWGWALLALTAVAVAFSIAKGNGERRRQLAPWWMLQLYALGNAVGTGVGRSGFGESSALASRYGSLAALFSIGLLGQCAVLVHRRTEKNVRRRRASTAVLVAATALLVTCMYGRGLPVLRYHLERAARQPALEFAVRNGIWDYEAARLVMPWPEHFFAVLPLIHRWRNVPFDREPLEPRLGDRIEGSEILATGPGGVVGVFDVFEPLTDKVARVSGWVLGVEPARVSIVLVSSDGVVRGRAFLGFEHPRLAAQPTRKEQLSGWWGHVMLVPDEHLTALVAIGAEGRYFRLEGEWPAMSVQGDEPR
jgi:hypothetical protein